MCDAIGPLKGQEFPSNLNRYLQRSFAFDGVGAPDTSFIFSKMGKFINLGFIKFDQSEWQGTRVHASGGTIGSQDPTVPTRFGTYLAEKARRVSELNQSVSDQQREKIDNFVSRNPDRVANSGTFQAMLRDLRSFGRTAFATPRNKGSDER